MKNFKGKAIYNPSGKAGEYSYWAVNFYNGCSARCEYCYNRHGITAKVLGADKPTLKKCLKDEDTALQIFVKEADVNRAELQEHGLFFNFVSDPCLPETFSLNSKAWIYCYFKNIPVKILTKQTWWLDKFEGNTNMAIGFTLTGHDELEPGAATNQERVEAMKKLHNVGFKTWASIEPIIDVESSIDMIDEICNHVDLIKIGLQSGKKYRKPELVEMYHRTCFLAEVYGFKVYFKDSFIEQARLNRESMPEFCVTRDYNIFK
jgi:DNA repair photolyase